MGFVVVEVDNAATIRDRCPTATKTRVKGARLAVPAAIGAQNLNEAPPASSWLIGVTFCASAYTDTDYFSLAGVSAGTILDDIYVKAVPQHIDLPVPIYAPGDLTFTYQNATATAKTVWADFHYAVP